MRTLTQMFVDVISTIQGSGENYLQPEYEKKNTHTQNERKAVEYLTGLGDAIHEERR